MAYEQRNNSGALFKNDKKQTEKQPDYTGNAVVNGFPMRVSAWLKKSQKGTTFMSLAFSEDQEKPKPMASDIDGKPSGTSAEPDDFSDVPF